MDHARDRAELRVFLLSHFGIDVAGEPVRLPTRKSELLLAYLLLNPGIHSRERIAARFWGDFPDSSARASLRNALAILRRRLHPDLLDSDRDSVGIRSGHPIWIDVVEFKRTARRFLEDGSVDPDQVDVALYTGDLLIDSYDDWVLEEREVLHHLYVVTLVESTRRMRSHSEYERALEYANLALEADPANEEAHQHIMFCDVALGNRDAALRQYESCRRAMREHLDVEPSRETERLYKWIREAPAERVPVAASVTNLPIPVTSFVGRQREITDLKGELASERLVTLTGAGGSGKTRLAVRLATEVLDGFRDGVWWVELAAIDDEDSLARSVAKALGVPEVPGQPTTETLTNFVKAKNLLLLFDNCEHLVGASASIADTLLSVSPELKILVTSRERLGAAGERVWRVQGLPVPERRTRSKVDDLLEFGAVRLFVKR
ncbi:MAG TPA: BTAD domain-containing putative transcriptional regulator, partial [Acidimicrobiia bacterium]|nr:BTAD domain-containing putative transcriptional regulator [Acidimicrobiia bacterium]